MEPLRKIIPLIMICLSQTAYSQLDAPVFLCESVEADGAVTLVWEAVSDPGGIFTAYSIYYRPDPSASFSLAGQVTNISQLTFTHGGAAADQRSRFYFLVAESTQGPSPPSDTLETIFLYLETDDNENVSLFWNPLHDPPHPTPNVQYQVYREYPPGDWQLLGQTQGFTFDHHFWSCNHQQHTVNFRIITLDFTTGCQSTSNITGAILSNLTQPDVPAMDSVSITPAGEAVIGWQPGLAPDIAGYIIYRVTTINDSIDFVPGIASTSYIDPDATPCGEAFRYAIAAVDSCGNKSPGTFLEPHQTLFLQEIDYDPCFLVNTLSWNAYVNFDPPLEGYEIHVSTDGSDFSLLATVGAGQTFYSHEDLAPTTSYTYFIRAFSQGRTKTSTSCSRSMTTYNSPFPQYMYLSYVTVGEDHRVELSFLADTSAHVNGYRIFRGEDMASMSLIGEVPPSGSEMMNFTDAGAETWAESYFYRVSVIDSCNNESFIANSSRTILLQVESHEDLINVLSWNAYESWEGGVSGYSIFRRLGEGGIPSLIGQTGPGGVTFSDDVSSLGQTGGRIIYFVEAEEGPGNPYGLSAISRSNEVLADVMEKVFVPNAISPYGINNRLKPVGSFISEENYLFVVYDRWGRQVFEAYDPADAWDGTYNGRLVEQGVYVYLLRFTTATGEIILRKGSVAVIF